MKYIASHSDTAPFCKKRSDDFERM